MLDGSKQIRPGWLRLIKENPAMEKKDFFDFMLKCVKETANNSALKEPQAFVKWFIEMYYLEPRGLYISDGSRDGKVDAFFKTDNDESIRHHVINSKFTQEYNNLAPGSFYDELLTFWQAFDNKDRRSHYLEKAVKPELRAHYKNLFECYDKGTAELIFLTNHRENENRYGLVQNRPVKVLHLDEIIQHLADDIDGAMPRTSPITFCGIGDVLSPEISESVVSTSIIFARLVDFIAYMVKDPYDLLFARNVRIGQGRTSVNKAIKDTFRDSPKEFVFSNNGITLLCEDFVLRPGGEITVENPRVVNGAQTLYSIKDVPDPSIDARVMVRIIRIPPPSGERVRKEIAFKKDIINKISIRSNQQNPIKQWNLVSGDDFQLQLYRYFRRKGLFYERREKEWNHRSRKLRSIGISRGPQIRRMAQLIASYRWNDKKLGPANARLSVAKLFQGTAYDSIRKTSEESAYKIYLVSLIVDQCFKELSKYKYVNSIKAYTYYTTFALVVRALTECGAPWDAPEFTEFLESDEISDLKLWRALVKRGMDHIYEQYKMAVRSYRKKTGVYLSLNNYFKSPSDIEKILIKPVPPLMKKISRTLLMSM
jgi:hypothetical protein